MRIIGNDPSVPRQEHAVASGTLPNGKPVVVNADGTVSVVSETALTQQVGSETVFEAAAIDGSEMHAVTFDSNSNKVIIAYQDEGNSDYGTAIVGTVDASGNSITFGSPTVFESARTEEISATFDSSNNKVVIAYQDYDNDRSGTAIVGTVSGTSISFGSAAVFEAGYSRFIGTCFDSNSNKVVIAYSDGNDSNAGEAVVATVSGTSISFGTVADFEGQAQYISAAFDSNSNKVVLSYTDEGNSNYGTAIVGTVSGTDISFGTAVVYNSSTTFSTTTTFDSNSNKIVTFFMDYSNNERGAALVGTVSGTSISFGSLAVFSTGTNNTTPGSAVFDSSLNKVVITYQDASNSNIGIAQSGTVSGTSITFDTATTFDTDRANIIGAAFDSNANRVVIAYEDVGNSNYGTAVVFQNSGTAQNITSENYIGISRSGAASGAGAIIDTQGAIADNLSGLTAGQSYFVQTDGTLGTTAGDPSVFAGTAVAATKLIVKG